MNEDLLANIIAAGIFATGLMIFKHYRGKRK
jgi:hypothetical protein